MSSTRAATAALALAIASATCGSPVPSPTSPEPGPPLGIIRIPFAEREMEVSLVGDPGIVTGWRAATDEEVASIRWEGDADIDLGTLTDTQVVLVWVGTVCDVEATLTVGSDRLVIVHAPRPGCDAMAVGRGMVLTYSDFVEPAGISVDLVDAVLLPEGP
jgi:hypothetical protein